ncbi:serine hydrolase [Longimicrobium sp.]|jgi:beta-lactamase class A|uniref:serine hydrolase n=1 Tax=Longimicrobium sp. TaxID=2029185 RepID=UPI002F948329
MPLIRLALLLALALLPACAPAAAQARSARASTDTAALRRTIENASAGYQGIVGVSVRNLATGESLSIRGGETFSSASLIKVAVLVALLDEVEKGTMRLDEPLSMLARDRVGGSGVLQHFRPGLQLTVEDAARLMIIISDNTATNLLLEKLNIRTVWTKMEALGLPHTKIHSKTFNRATSVAMDSSVKYGLGVTTPDETVELFARLHAGTAVSPRMDSLALAMLRENEDWNKLTRWLPEGARAAHKSGDVDQARNDCGILYGPDAPVAICVMTRENRDTSYATDNPANLLIARIGALVYQHFNPSAPPPAIPR